MGRLHHQKEDRIHSCYTPSSPSSMKELRDANAALQNEVASLQHAAAAKASYANSQAAAVATVRAELSETMERHQEADTCHHTRIKDLQKKLKEEAAGRAASDALLVRHRSSAAEVAPHMANAAAALTVLRQARKQLEAGLASEKEAALELQKHGATLTARLRSEEALRQRVEVEKSAALAVALPVVGGLSQNDNSSGQQKPPLVGAVEELVSRLHSALAALAETRNNAEVAASAAEDARRTHTREHKVEVERLHAEVAELRDENAAASNGSVRDHKAIHTQKQLVKEAEQRAEDRGAAADRLAAQLENLTADSQEQAATIQTLEASLKRSEATSAARGADSERDFEAAAAARNAAANSERQRNDAIAAAKQAQRNEEAASKRLTAADEATAAAQAELDSLRNQLYDMRTKVDTAQRELQQSVTKCKSFEEAAKRATAEATETSNLGAHKADGLKADLESTLTQAAKLRTQNAELLESKRAADVAAQRAGEEAKEARDRMKESSAEAATARTAAEKLRRELSAATGAHEQDLGEKARMLSEILEAMQQEEAAKCSALADVRSLHQALDQAQAAMHDAEEGRRIAEDAAASQTAALAATKRRADTYREENRALLSNYDEWLRTLVSAKGGTAAAAAHLKLPACLT